MDNKEKLINCIKEGKFDEAKAAAFQLIQIDDDLDAVKEVLASLSELKETTTWKIVDKMTRYL